MAKQRIRVVARVTRIAVFATTLAAPSFAQAAPNGDPPVPNILNPELADDLPEREWVREGGSTGDAAPSTSKDPRMLNRKIRRAGKITLVGGAIAVLGGITAISGATLMYLWSPRLRLERLADKNDGLLPANDARRHRAIQSAHIAPIVTYAGLGVLAGGVITAAVFRHRVKKLRKQRKASTALLSPTFFPGGAALQWKVRF